MVMVMVMVMVVPTTGAMGTAWCRRSHVTHALCSLVLAPHDTKASPRPPDPPASRSHPAPGAHPCSSARRPASHPARRSPGRTRCRGSRPPEASERSCSGPPPSRRAPSRGAGPSRFGDPRPYRCAGHHVRRRHHRRRRRRRAWWLRVGCSGARRCPTPRHHHHHHPLRAAPSRATRLARKLPRRRLQCRRAWVFMPALCQQGWPHRKAKHHCHRRHR